MGKEKKGKVRKSDKYEKKEEESEGANKAKKQPNRKNHKAFNVANVVSAKRNMQRNMDKAQQKEVVPLRSANDTTTMPAPDLIVVMGPQGVGKSTLIRSLVKLYTGQNLVDILGPITVVAGDRKRYTFFECPMDLYSMADLAKVADLIIVMIDASYGFEMETFEFINLLQLHGMPKVMGVLTHLDAFRSTKTLQNTKKAIKHRFWTEIFKGAKLYDMMGTINRKYRKHEIKRLSLAISRIKYRPLVWRNTHPYVVVDRVEESHSTSKDDVDDGLRDLTLFGFVRGTHLKSSMKVHLIGAGDFDIAEATVLPDPVPTPKQQQLQLMQIGQKGSGNMRKRKDSLLYAPMANVGRVVLDGDDVYIDLHRVNYSQRESLYLPDQHLSVGTSSEELAAEGPMALVKSLQEVRKGQGMDSQLQDRSNMTMKLFADDNDEEVDFGDVDNKEYEEDVPDSDDEEEDEVEEDEDDRWDDEEEEIEDFTDNYHRRSKSGKSGSDSEDDSDDEEDEEVEDNEDEEHDHEEDEEELQEGGDANSESDVNLEEGDHQARRLQTQFEEQLGSFEKRQPRDIMASIYGSVFDQKAWTSGNTSNANSTSNKKHNSEKQSLLDDSDDESGFFQSKQNSSNTTNNTEEKDIVDSSRLVRHHSYHLQHNQLLLRKFNSNADSNTNGNIIDCKAKKSTVSTQRSMPSLATISSTDYVRGGSLYHAFKTRFAAGRHKNTGVHDNSDDEEEDGYGELVDLEGTDIVTSNKKSKEVDSINGDNDDSDSDAENDRIDEQLRQMHADKKAAFSAQIKEQNQLLEDDVTDEVTGKGRRGRGEGKVKQDEEDEDEKNLILEAQQKFLQQSERNALEFGKEGEAVRTHYEGFRQGLYVKLKLKKVPVEFLRNFNARHPVVLGGLLPSETQMGFITARVKKHRWFKRVLKSQDPLVFSVGWRRYQTLPLYTTSDVNDRQRYLKYTHENMHCTAVFYGPLVAPNTGILAFPSADRQTANFRIALTGIALEQVATPEIMKKLKLVGTPTKIFKNTAFVSGMFSSALEVAKFEGAKIKTVSGVRGAIKKAVLENNQLNKTGGKSGVKGGFAPGSFRATFEDKILLSDLVVCRLWVNVLPKRFYNPVLSLLDDSAYTRKQPAVYSNKPKHIEDFQQEENDDGDDEDDDGEEEEEEEDQKQEGSEAKAVPKAVGLMRNTAQLRRDLQVAQTISKDSVYKPIVRQERVFNKLKIPTKLQNALPYKTRVRTQHVKRNPQSYTARRTIGIGLMEPEERKTRALMATVSTIARDKQAKRKVSDTLRREKKQKEKARESERFSEVHKEEKKKRYRDQGLEDERRKKAALKGNKKRRLE